MVDTGNVEDLLEVVEAATGAMVSGSEVKIAFGGGVTSQILEEVVRGGADIIDIGRAIIDAPILDFRLDVSKRVSISEQTALSDAVLGLFMRDKINGMEPS